MLSQNSHTTKNQLIEFTYHLVPSEKAKKYFCIQCGGLNSKQPLFIGQYQVITVDQGGALRFFHPPITIICPHCNSRINIQTIV